MSLQQAAAGLPLLVTDWQQRQLQQRPSDHNRSCLAVCALLCCPSACQALMIVIGNPAVLMHDKHWLALLMTCQQHGACVGQPMPDLSGAADAAAAAAGAGGAQHGGASRGRAANGAGGGAASSSSGRDLISSNLPQQIVQLEKLMASIALSQAVDEVAAQQLLLGFGEGQPLGFQWPRGRGRRGDGAARVRLLGPFYWAPAVGSCDLAQSGT